MTAHYRVSALTLAKLLADEHAPTGLVRRPAPGWMYSFARWARGDPNLTASEEQLLAEVGPGCRSLSAKQVAVVEDLSVRLGYDDLAPVKMDDQASDDDGSPMLEPDEELDLVEVTVDDSDD